ncbi:MAG: hypothetical protein ABI315_09790 [Bacteroidia bacterium]
MAMLKRENKLMLIFLITICFLTACNNVSKNRDKQVVFESKISKDYVKKKYINYSNEYTVLKDSVNKYVDSTLKSYLGEYIWDWEVDSMICMNSEGNKLVATINISIGACPKCWSDEIKKILGKKINGVWYFFKGGGTLTVPRNYYGKDEMHPLTFHELSQIAREEFLESALIKSATGEYVVNDKWIDAHFYQNGYGSYKTKVEYDSVHWIMILQKWKVKIDTNEYKHFRRKVTPKPAV